MKTVFVDMDGVLTDFNSNYKKINGMTAQEVRNSCDRKEFSLYWERYIMLNGFASQDWFQGAQELVEFLNKQDVQKCILSSSGGMKSHNVVQAQKHIWLMDHGITWPVVVVPGRRFKAGFASATTALIDDTADVIESFTSAGGLGILHEPDRKWNSTYQIEEWLKK